MNPFVTGICSFHLRRMSDGLCAEVERRLSGLPIDFRVEETPDAEGQARRRLAWILQGESNPTFARCEDSDRPPAYRPQSDPLGRVGSGTRKHG